MTRKPMMVANWKMNLGPAASGALATEIMEALNNHLEVDCILCPAFPALPVVRDLLSGTDIQIGAQDCHVAEQGAFTGEVSCSMLKELVSHVIVGHSERRMHCGETDQDVNQKVAASLSQGLIPIICVGENEVQNASGAAQAVITRQVTAALEHAARQEAARVILAYEPVWAIGTGKAATDQYAGEVCGEVIRLLLADLYDAELAESVPILYGGSTNPGNIQGFMAQPDVDGALIGGASLSSDQYCAMVSLAR